MDERSGLLLHQLLRAHHNAVSAALGMAPFGDNTILISDMSTQYVEFFCALKNGDLFFSWSKALGTAYVGVFSYYVSSPLSLLTLLVPNEQMPVGLLFLAVLGTCGLAAGNAAQIIDASNPAAEAFKLAAGDLGYRLFGLCLFSAGVSSVVGAAFTSVSFLKTLHPVIMKYEKWFVVGFIAFSTLMMVIVGNAAQLLIIAGAVNGLILPISLVCMLAASRNKKIVGDYKHPLWLTVLGVVVILISAYVGIQAVPGIMNLFG